MYRLLSILALSLLALSTSVVAQSTTSDAVGFNTLTNLTNSDTLESVSFTRPPEFTGTIQSASGNLITVNGAPGWTNNQFVYVMGSQAKHYYVLIGSVGSSNTKEGH